MRALTPASDARAAEWVVAGLRGFGESVLSVVPAGFAMYVRLFHPAYRDRVLPAEPVTWAEIATATGARVHPGMQMDAISGRSEFRNERPPEGVARWPEVGSLTPEIAVELSRALRRHTTTPETCWLAVWSGYTHAYGDELIRRSATFQAPAREYYLLEGALETVEHGVTESTFQTPNLWWPDDRAWCVATEIDFNTTYVGCSVEAGEAVLRLGSCEVLAIDPATGVGGDSDVLNQRS